MTRIAVIVGISRVDPSAYDGHWTGAPLRGGEADARVIARQAQRKGLNVVLLLGNNARRQRVLTELAGVTSSLRADDLLVFFFAGHGGFVPNENRDPLEEGPTDETLCLFDGMLIDDELNCIWSSANAQARIFSCIDSCHSGTVLGMRAARNDERSPSQISRRVSDQVLDDTYENHKQFYCDIQERTARCGSVGASLLHIGACGDDQEAEEYNGHGIFSTLLDRAFDQNLSYAGAYDWLVDNSPSSQTPTRRTLGRRDPEFENRSLFT